MAEQRYNRLDNQSPTQTQLQNQDLNIPRSAFDFSTIHSGNALIGALIPVDCFDVVPNEDISISMSNLLEFRNPTTRQLLNGFRVYFHGYYNKLTDLWEGAKNFLDTGLSGSLNLTRPALKYSHVIDNQPPLQINANNALSLLNYLGLPAEQGPYTHNSNGKRLPPIRCFQTSLSDGNTFKDTVFYNASNGYFPADCALAYQRNWRDFYSNRNLLQNNKYWFPDNENHFILSYGCEEAVCVKYGDEMLADVSDATLSQDSAIYYNLVGYNIFSSNGDWITPEPNNPSTVVLGSSREDIATRSPNLSGLKFRQFRGDRFTTALPFPDLIRGEIPVIEFNKQTLPVKLSNNLLSTGSVVFNNADSYLFKRGSDNHLLAESKISSNDFFTADVQVDVPLSQITQNAIRALETFTVFKERNARISSRDSYYNGFIEAQFGFNPHTYDSRGTYLGGFYQDFSLSAVTQLSQSTDDSQLGQKAGQGLSSGSGTICSNFHTTDFGWIQIYMSIVPDVFYTQGKPRMFDKKKQLDMYFPLFNNLEPQAILNKELYVSGVSADDNDVFAYEDRYSEYKSRPNRVSGFMALSHSVADFDSSRIMARRFTSTPALNSTFVTMIPENIDMSVFTVQDEPPFDFSCGISVRRVFPGPYTAVPGSMSSQLHA